MFSDRSVNSQPSVTQQVGSRAADKCRTCMVQAHSHNGSHVGQQQCNGGQQRQWACGQHREAEAASGRLAGSAPSGGE